MAQDSQSEANEGAYVDELDLARPRRPDQAKSPGGAGSGPRRPRSRPAQREDQFVHLVTQGLVVGIAEGGSCPRGPIPKAVVARHGNQIECASGWPGTRFGVFPDVFGVFPEPDGVFHVPGGVFHEPLPSLSLGGSRHKL